MSQSPSDSNAVARRSTPLMGAIGLAAILLVSSFAAGAVLLATRHGVGLGNDSTTYITEARQLLRGHGLSTAMGVPVTHFPPLFPMLLAVPGVLGVDALVAARWLNMGLLAGNVALIGWVVYRGANRSAVAGIIGALFAATSVDLLNAHAWAMSEPLFLFTGFAGLAVLQSHLREARYGKLVAAALLIGAACLARYAGQSLIPTAVLALLMTPGRAMRQRLARAAFFTLIALLPTFIWFTRNHVVAATTSNRQIVYHPVSPQRLADGIETIAAWFTPNLTFRFSVAVVIALVTLLVVLLLASRRSRLSTPLVFAIFLPMYAVFVLVSLVWFDAQIPLDSRMLCPLLVAGICCVIPAGAQLLCVIAPRLPAIRPLVLLACAGFACWSAYREAMWITQSRRYGLGYSSREWQTSGVLAAVRNLPADACIYSNAPGAVLVLTDHITGDIPQKFDRNSTLVKSDYESRMELMRGQMQKYGGYLAYFRNVGSRHNLPVEDELLDAIPMVEVLQEGGGVLYRAEPAKP